MAKIFAVYGSSGSYKTTTSLALAHYISKSEPNANVIVVGTDNTKPLIPIVAPNEKKFAGSLGRCLTNVSFETDDVRKNLLHVTDHIFVLGYNIRENFNTFPQPDNDRLLQIFSYLNSDAQYIIVDCMPYVIGDKVTSFAIRNADRTIELFTCDLNGLVFDGSQEPILQSEQYKYRTFIRAVSLDNRFKQDVTAMKNALGRISGEIPYSTKAAEYFNQATILQNGVDDLMYNRAIKSLAKLLMGGKD